MRHASWTVGVVTLVGSGAYVFVYVLRWEWHRALLVGLLFLCSLVVLSTALVLRRLAAVESRLPAGGPDPREDQRLLRLLRSAPAEPAPFPWLRPESLDRTSIFIPVLLGSGVLVSGLAWLVERIAGGAARAGVERDLARDLGTIAFPAGDLVPGRAEALAADDGWADSPGLRLLLGPVGDP